MDRDEFMELVYETFADEPDNVLANGIIEAADALVEYEKAQLSQEDTTKDATFDLISRQAVIDAYGDWYVEEGTEEGFIGTVKQLLEGLPSAQRNGTWITDINDNDNAYCSERGLFTTKDLLKRIALVGENKPKFCPNCGAKMEDKGW